MNSFSRDVSRFVAKTGGNMEAVVRKSTFGVMREVIEKSPVDKGTFVANWQPAIGVVPAGTLDVTDPTRGATLAKVEAVAEAMKVGDVAYLANNLPYGPRIEYEGWSKIKAPQGMVRLSVQRWQPIVDEAVRQVVAGQ
jgi:hypothetical protein